MFRGIVISLILLVFGSCQKADEPLFEFQIETPVSILSGLNNIEAHYIFISNVPTNIASYLGSRDPSSIARMVPIDAVLRSRSGGVPFNIIREISIRVIPSSDLNDRREVFYQNIIPLNHSGDLKLFGSLTEIKDILLNDKINLEIRLTFKTFTITELDNTLIMNFNAYGPE